MSPRLIHSLKWQDFLFHGWIISHCVYIVGHLGCSHTLTVSTILFSIVAAPVYIPTNCAQGFPFLHILHSHLLFLVFLTRNSHSNRWGNSSLWFWWASLCICMSYLGKCPFRSSTCFLIGLLVLLLLSYMILLILNTLYHFNFNEARKQNMQSHLIPIPLPNSMQPSCRLFKHTSKNREYNVNHITTINLHTIIT